MKKLSFAVLSLALLFSLSGCMMGGPHGHPSRNDVHHHVDHHEGPHHPHDSHDSHDSRHHHA